ncbi:MAG: hypothetical protein F4089_15480 [Gammaproteobacteria bacterium]|nr:hypothetical protein [Gemmatimonadota bacterium]MYD27996.1 hypothetical protein [Dehalococcoidia bacterium]MYI65284.1 hypothetical protein [Gemmatimonadota bacterium]MYJ76393.1 hypothetical protein [Gammaproteobacteria bacterium]
MTTFTRTNTETFTRTSANYLVSKVAADLRQMQRLHGAPSDAMIADYVEELITLLAGGYVDSVEYGFKRGNNWVVALRYLVNSDGSISATDDRPGRVPLGDVRGTGFGSFLVTSSKWSILSSVERERIERALPFVRTPGSEPGGTWNYGGRAYSKDGVSLRRGAIGQ